MIKMRMTKAQQQSAMRLWEKIPAKNDAGSFLQFRRKFRSLSDGSAVALIDWVAVWVRIDPDGKSSRIFQVRQED